MQERQSSQPAGWCRHCPLRSKPALTYCCESSENALRYPPMLLRIDVELSERTTVESNAHEPHAYCSRITLQQLCKHSPVNYSTNTFRIQRRWLGLECARRTRPVWPPEPPRRRCVSVSTCMTGGGGKSLTEQ
eukprot:1507239-Prymnesium_polylepis.1